MKIIDPHIHLFALEHGEYQWLYPQNPPLWPDKAMLCQDYSEQSLTLTAPLELSGFVHIEAGFDNVKPWREIQWLEQHCQRSFKAIAMTDITLPPNDFAVQIAKLTGYKSVVGGRYILDEQAASILANKNSLSNLRLMAQQSLIFELQMPLADNQAVDSLLALIKQIPRLQICINHAGSPPTNVSEHSHWYKNLKRLGQLANIYIKCSGFEMSERQYPMTRKLSIVNDCLNTFGVDRVMLASNFPLSLWRESYQHTWQYHSELAENLMCLQSDIIQLCYDNARQFYRF